MLGTRALSVVLTGLLAAAQALAAPTANERRALRVSGEKYKNLSKKAQIILIASICGFIGLVLIGFIIFVVWVKKDIGEKIRDRLLDWRIKRRVDKETRLILKELEQIPDPPSTATAQPNSSAQNGNSRDNLLAPSSPNSKAATDTPSPSEKEQQQLPPYTETAEISMPQPAYIQSQPDPRAPVPYTRDMAP